MIKRFLFAAAIFLLFSFSAYAEKNYTSDKIVFLPQDFYVGDLVEMRIVIKPQEGVAVKKPETFPDSFWVEVENADVIALEENEFELRVFLRPYAPGIRTLPVLQFGDIILKDIRIQTKSVLDDENSAFAPPAGQILIPGTNYYIALIVGLVFLVPLFVIFFWTRLRKGVLNFIHEKQRRKPYRRIIKVLRELEEKMEELKGKEFYTIFIEELKKYLSSRGTIDYSSATVREASGNITADFGKAAGYYHLVKLMELSDQVKFGSRKVLIKRRKEDLESVRGSIEAIEELSNGGGRNVDL